MKAALAIDARDRIGEAPIWDAAGARLIWSDLERGVVHAAMSDASGAWSESSRWSLARPLAAAIPRARGGLVVAAGTEILSLDEAGGLATFARIDADPASIRFNDAKCDPRGRLWAGTIATDFGPSAALYRVDADGATHTMLEGLRVANGMDWSPDGKVFYFTDSLTRRVDAFDFDVEISTPGATSCAFGGARCEELFITSLGRRMPDVARTLGLTDAMMSNDGPHSGGLFVCRPGVAGKSPTRFAG